MDSNFRERYSRHFPLETIGKVNQLKLAERKVLIAGMGGLGTASSELMASIGIGYLRLVDYDVVEMSNLPRQKLYSEDDIGKAKVDVAEIRLKERNPAIEIDTQPTRIDALSVEELLDGIDLVIDALDTFTSRRVLFRKCHQLKIPYVFCGAIAEQANVMAFDHSPDNPCLECVIGDSKDNREQSCEVMGVHPAVLQIAASIQVSEGIKLLLAQQPELIGKMMFIDLISLDFEKIKINKSEDCRVCGTKETLDELDTGKPGDVTRGYREIKGLGKALVTSLCGRDTKIIDPNWEIEWNFENIKEEIDKNWNVVVSGESYITFSVGDIGVSLLKSGVTTIRGAKTAQNALKTFEDFMNSLTIKIK